MLTSRFALVIFLNRVVRLIVRMEVSQKVVDAANLVSSPRRAASWLPRFQRSASALKGKRPLGDRPHEHHAKGARV